MRAAPIALALIASACAKPSALDPAPRTPCDPPVIAGWRRVEPGDFRGYMEGFKNPDVVFRLARPLSRDCRARSIIMSATMAAIRARGRLHFFEIRVEMLARRAH